MHALQQLNDKLDELLKRYTALQTENKRLKKTVSQQIKVIDSLHEKLAAIEQNVTALHIGKSLEITDQKDAVKKQLDIVISEIDKILNTLND
ncbi:MAG TPA: hypothetical protein VN721_08175 [Flavipsychrobacter sp.]|nr:hypothetical protein [Flavipsychrobacter sp.]